MRPPHAPPARVIPGRRGGTLARVSRRSALRNLPLIAALAAALPGCSLFVMGGKMLFGDPTETPVFEKAAGVDLTDGDHTVLVLASSPESVKVRFPEIDQEVMRRVGRKLHTEGAEVANSDRVLDWVEERGGVWSESQFGQIAEEFEVDYVIVVELDRFDWHELHSPDLLRGRSGGWIRAYGSEDGSSMGHVLAGEFESVYPTNQPESVGSVTEKVFRERYLDRLCEQAAQRFVPYRRVDTIY